MEKNSIKGTYFEIDFSRAIIINDHNYERIDSLLKELMEIQLCTLKGQYKQGFLDVTMIQEMTDIPNYLDKFYEEFIKLNQIGKQLCEVIDQTILSFTKKYLINDPFIDYLYNITFKLKTILHYDKIRDKGDVILKLKNYEPQDLFHIPKSVVLVIFESFPSPLVADILEAYKKIFIVDKNIYQQKKLYQIQPFKLDEIEIVDVNPIIHDKFQLGLQIHCEAGIELCKNLKPDYIVVEPEKAYIHSNGMVDYEARLAFYKNLKSTFCKSSIQMILPKIQMLDCYFNYGGETKLNNYTFSKYYYIYQNEIKAFCQIMNKDAHILIPKIECYKAFRMIKYVIKDLCLAESLESPVIGLHIDHAKTYFNLNDFLRYKFAAIDTYCAHDYLPVKEVMSLKYVMQYSEIKQQLYKNGRKTFLMGNNLNNVAFFKKLLARGFKRFVVNYRLFDTYWSIIHAHVQNRGQYRKKG